MNKNRYIIAGCVLFLLILAVFFLKQVKRGERKIPFNDAIRVEAVSVWEKLPYISIQDETVLDRYLKELTIHDEKGLLSAEQKELLLKSFKELLYAYSKGTWEDFAKVRFPEGSSYQQNEKEWSKITTEWFKAHPEATRKDLPEDEQLYRWWIEKDQPGEGIYKDYWQGLAMDQTTWDQLKARHPSKDLFKNAQVGIFISQIPEWKSDSVLLNLYNTGLQPVDNSFDFTFWESDDVKERLEKEFLTAEIFFFIQPMKSDSPIPIYSKYIWEEKSKQWLLNYMCRGDLFPMVDTKYLEKEWHLFKF